MGIVEALQKENIRLSNGSRWLTWNNMENSWTIWERRPYAKNTTIVITTENESKAVDCLLDG